MFVTSSRNSDLDVKRFAKYFVNYFPNLNLIPRGKSNLKSLFEKSFYIGYKYFLIFSKIKNSKDVILNI
jgi:rRNA maturation protein Rpf1